MTQTTRTLPDFTQAPMQPEIGKTCSWPAPGWTPVRSGQPRQPGLSGRATLLIIGAVFAVLAVVGGGVALANQSKSEPFIRNQDVGAITAKGGTPPATQPVTHHSVCHNTGSWVTDLNGVGHHVNVGGDEICTSN